MIVGITHGGQPEFILVFGIERHWKYAAKVGEEGTEKCTQEAVVRICPKGSGDGEKESQEK